MVNVAKVSPGVRLIDGAAPVFNQLTIADGGLVYESAASGITAFASATQATATPILNELTRVTTVVTTGDGILLPASAPGLTIILENASANAMQVFAQGSDTINAVAGSTGVSQMGGSEVIYVSYAAGAWFANGLGTGYAGSLETQSTATGVTALAGGQGSAAPVTTMMTNVTTCPASGGVVLPASAVGLAITIANNGANSLSVFPPSGSTMNGVLNAASALGAAVVGIYFCVAANTWISK